MLGTMWTVKMRLKGGGDGETPRERVGREVLRLMEREAGRS